MQKNSAHTMIRPNKKEEEFKWMTVTEWNYLETRWGCYEAYNKFACADQRMQTMSLEFPMVGINHVACPLTMTKFKAQVVAT